MPPDARYQAQRRALIATEMRQHEAHAHGEAARTRQRLRALERREGHLP